MHERNHCQLRHYCIFYIHPASIIGPTCRKTDIHTAAYKTYQYISNWSASLYYLRTTPVYVELLHVATFFVVLFFTFST